MSRYNNSRGTILGIIQARCYYEKLSDSNGDLPKLYRGVGLLANSYLD